MSPSLGSAILSLDVDGAKLAAGLDAAGKKAREWGGKMISAGGDIANGLRPLSNAITGIISDSVEMASSTEESLNKVRVVFQENAGAIEDWAKTSSTSLGISRQKALEAAGTFGNLFTALGLARGPAADLSMDVVQLAADLASFNNIKPEEALEKLRAGLVGEAEPLRTLGVNLSAATMEAYAMRTGMIKAGETMTDAQKVQARYGVIVEQTKNAQGDFARTSDGLANSLRIQTAEQENAKAQLGAALLPVVLEVTKAVTGLVTWFTNLSPEVQKVILIVGGLIAILGPALTIIGVITSGVGLLMGAIGFLIPVIGGATVAVGGMTIALGPLILVVGALALAALLLKTAWENNWGDIQGVTARAISFWQDAFSGVQMFILTTWRNIVVGIASAVNGVIGTINDLIGAYNAMAERLGLPTIAEIELITPNLQAVEDNINSVARDRVSRIIQQIVAPVNASGETFGMYAEGTDHITRGPELFMAGEAGPERVTVTPLGRGSAPAGGGGPLGGGHGHPVIMDGRLVASLVGARHVRGAAFAGGAIG